MVVEVTFVEVTVVELTIVEATVVETTVEEATVVDVCTLHVRQHCACTIVSLQIVSNPVQSMRSKQSGARVANDGVNEGTMEGDAVGSTVCTLWVGCVVWVDGARLTQFAHVFSH